MSINKTKDGMSREEIIRWRLGKENMLKMAKEVNRYNQEFKKDLICELAKKEMYLRIGGEQFRAVSLNDSTPLSGYGSSCRTLSTAIERFEATAANFVGPETLERKGERRLQAWMIKEGLCNGRSLKSCFRTPLLGFDDIWFVLDEVSMGDNNHRDLNGNGASRCDLLCISRKGSKWYPMVIELKYGRKGDDLLGQVQRYVDEMSTFRLELDALLETITGKQISQEPIQKMVVMPAATDGQENHPRVRQTYNEYEKAGVHLVEYKSADGFGLYSVELNCP